MLKILERLGLKRLFLLAILIRLLLMPFYFHPDIKTYHFQAQFLKTGVFNIYSFLEENKERLPIREEFVYFPLTYFFLGSYQIIASPFMGKDFSDWLSDASQGAVDRIGIYRYLFILKFPYLILDLIIPFLLIKFFSDINRQRKVFILWLFNPISILIIYIFSNLDIIPVFLSIVSLLLFRKGRFILAGIILGLSASFKAYTLLFLPILLLFNKNLKDKVLTSLSSIITLILVLLPFWSTTFLNSALISGLTTRIAFPGITIGFGETLMISVVSLTVFYFWILRVEKKELEYIGLYIFSLLLLLFSTIHYHIQWLLWIVPFIIIVAVFKDSLLKIVSLWLILASLIPILYNDKFMNVSLLSALSNLYTLLPTTFTVVQKIYDPIQLQSVIHSIIFGLSFILVWEVLNLEKK